MGNWSELPLDLLEFIEGHMNLYIDKVRIRAVCVSWNSHLSKMPNHKVKQLPWMLQALDNKREAPHGLFNPLDKKVYEVDLPEAQGKLFKGSSFGWVVTVEDLDSNSLDDMYLVNPLTRTRIKLPPRSKFPDVKSYHADKVGEEYVVFTHDYFDAEGFRSDPLFGGFDSEDYDSDWSTEEFEHKLQTIDSHFVSKSLTWKVVLSSTPYDDNCTVVAIYGHSERLAYCKCNDKKWRPINVGEYGIGVLDVIFHKGKLHAINDVGDLLVFENIGVDSDIKATEEAVPMRATQTAYLTECFGGELIVVKRYFDFSRIIIHDPKNPLPRTNGFEVYKLDSINSSWVKVQNIGDDILFLGLNSSLRISSHDLLGQKGNCIYFTDYTFSFDINKGQEEDSDVGVFNLEDGTFRSMPGFECHPRFLWPPPLWVNIV
ncbi:hypothetical protein LguiA_029229 [Lonicera macranthoides]